MKSESEIGQNHPQSGNYAPLDSHLWADATYPLGAHYRGDSVTFAVYSKNASQILLEIYDRPTGENAKYAAIPNSECSKEYRIQNAFAL